MAQKTSVELQAYIDAYIKTNGTKSITGSQMNTILTDFVDSLVLLTGNQTIEGVKIFSDPAIFNDAITIQTPTADTNPATKKYVDDNFVDLTTNQTIEGIKQFDVIPTMNSGLTPSTDYQLTTKKYVDDAVAKPYKVYTALLSQSGTSAPTAVVLENTLGGLITFTYSGVGNYTIDSVDELFTIDKTFVMKPTEMDDNINYRITIEGLDYDVITINSYNNGTFANDIISRLFIEIRVYD